MSTEQQTIPACPKVGIVLVNYNGMRFLPGCLRSLEAISYSNAVVMVVDNASSDGSQEWLKQNYPELPLVCHSENLGITGGNNAGMKWCLENSCDWIMLLNNDTEVEPDFLSLLMEQSAPDRMLAPRIFYSDDRNRINNHFGSYDYWRGIHKDLFYNCLDSEASSIMQEGTMANTCALLFPKTLPETVGWQDPKYFIYYDDVDYITRAVRMGYRVFYVPQAKIYHKESSSSGGLHSPLASYYNMRNRLYFMFKHQKNPVALLFFIFYFTLTRTILFTRFALHKQFSQIIISFHALSDYARGHMGKADPSRFLIPTAEKKKK